MYNWSFKGGWGGGQKLFEEKMARIFSKFDENYKTTGPRLTNTRNMNKIT